MGYFSEQIKNYLSTATKEQLSQDQKILEKFACIGPTIEEYFNELEYIPETKIINQIASPEFSPLDFSFC